MAYASVIAHSAVIRGNLRGDTSLEILGRVEGDVGVTGDVALGPDAVVVGSVSGARVLIGGSVEGDVTGTDAVVVEDTGRVVGDLAAPRIGVSEGAHVQGSVRTSGASTAPSRPAARAAAQESRSAHSPPVDRARPIAATPAPAPVAASAPKPPPAPTAKRLPPPPVITAPRPGVRARKKLARR